MYFLTEKIKKLLVVTALCGSFYVSPAQAAYEKNYIGEMDTYTAVYEDTLVHLARKHGLGFVELRAANPMLDPWIPGADAKVILPKKNLLPDVPREGIVINLAEMRVYAYLNGDNAPYTYPIGIGREGLDTPMGKTKVTRKKDGPVWHPTKRMRDEDPELPAAVPPGPDNPLGTHAVYLGWPTYLIHGTTRPYGIGRRVSSGCMRMYPEDIIKFFDQVPVGTAVNVIHQPLKLAWIDNELYLEAHPNMEQAIRMEETGTTSNFKITDEEMAYIRNIAGEHQDLLNWPRIRDTVRDRAGYPVRIARYFDEDLAAAEDENDVSKEEAHDAEASESVIPIRKPENAEMKRQAEEGATNTSSSVQEHGDAKVIIVKAQP